MSNDQVLNQLSERYPLLKPLKSTIEKATEAIIECYSSGGKLLVCGNGGSCSDAEHLVGEMMKSFEMKRPVRKEIAVKLARISGERGKYLAQKLESGLPSISLCSQTSLTTAICNDMDASLIFAQQIICYGSDEDVLLGITTSGNSQNMIDACITAKAMNLKVIGLTGITGGKIKEYCNILLNVPEKETARVQELHLPVLHAICAIIENHFYGNNK
jgi:D-sedoheptulose 7-phosphate isomerase